MMFNGSMQNDHSIKSHTSEPYDVKDKKRVTEGRNTIVVSKKKSEYNLIEKVKRYFSKNKDKAL